jgi:hypothetical protein
MTLFVEIEAKIKYYFYGGCKSGLNAVGNW